MGVYKIEKVVKYTIVVDKVEVYKLYNGCV